MVTILAIGSLMIGEIRKVRADAGRQRAASNTPSPQYFHKGECDE